LSDSQNISDLTIPAFGRAIAYKWLGIGQIQSARMLVRDSHTAFQADGNYGIKYTLKFLYSLKFSIKNSIKSCKL
jgi:hypothetical protein